MPSGVEYCCAAAEELIGQFETRDPFRIASGLGIHVMHVSNFTELKGMYKVIKRIPFIMINSNMTPELQRIVCAHELGHDRLHRRIATSQGLAEMKLFSSDTRLEYEANLFASALLLPTEETLELLYDGKTVREIAQITRSDVNLVAMKVDFLRDLGYPLRRADCKGNFLHGKYSAEEP